MEPHSINYAVLFRLHLTLSRLFVTVLQLISHNINVILIVLIKQKLYVIHIHHSHAARTL